MLPTYPFVMIMRLPALSWIPGGRSLEGGRVIGSRMTGAGFGGCTVSIVKTEAIDGFIEKVGAEYLKKIGYAADFYVVEIGDGPSLI